MCGSYNIIASYSCLSIDVNCVSAQLPEVWGLLGTNSLQKSHLHAKIEVGEYILPPSPHPVGGWENLPPPSCPPVGGWEECIQVKHKTGIVYSIRAETCIK